MPFLLVLLSWMGFSSLTSSSPVPAGSTAPATATAEAGAAPASTVTPGAAPALSADAAWQLSPQAECEQQRRRDLALPVYCQGMALRGVIPDDDEALLALARQVMISTQLFFGDTRYGDSEARATGSMPAVGLGFAALLPAVADYARLGIGAHLDRQHSQRWLTRDLAGCGYGGTVSARIQDRGDLGRIDIGDQWAVGEYGCLEPAFAPRPGPASFWLYDVTSQDQGLQLKASGEMRRELIGLSLRASLPAVTLTLDPASSRLSQRADAMSYCANLPSTGPGKPDDGTCRDLAVLLERVELSRDSRVPGLIVREPAHFTLVLDRQPDGRHLGDGIRLDIVINHLEVPPRAVLPTRGDVIIMGRHDDRLILRFTPQGQAELQRLSATGQARTLIRPIATLYDYAAWLADIHRPARP